MSGPKTLEIKYGDFYLKIPLCDEEDLRLMIEYLQHLLASMKREVKEAPQ
ncbi:MAG: hypothetical protein ABC585_05660 [Candidatus Methanosuratincola petrocarbonis]